MLDTKKDTEGKKQLILIVISSLIGSLITIFFIVLRETTTTTFAVVVIIAFIIISARQYEKIAGIYIIRGLTIEGSISGGNLRDIVYDIAKRRYQNEVVDVREYKDYFNLMAVRGNFIPIYTIIFGKKTKRVKFRIFILTTDKKQLAEKIKKTIEEVCSKNNAIYEIKE